MQPADEDRAIRTAAFEHVRNLSQRYGSLPWSVIAEGFAYRGQSVHLATRAAGIFKPRQMDRVLSIRTSHPRQGRARWYDDQAQVHAQIYAGEESIAYAFQGSDPDSHDNRLLRAAHEEQLPLIYFLATAPGLYQAVAPVFVANWRSRDLRVDLVIGDALDDRLGRGLFESPQDSAERRYAMRLVKQRLHQAQFREAVLGAYGGRCAVSGLPEGRLLDAAHIVEDRHERFGQPVVPNGLPLSKLHHGAFDAHLIGIDPDYRIHVSGALMRQQDGPILQALKDLDRQTLHLPPDPRDRPDRDRLAARFEAFKTAA